ncbi:MAG: hypothetical protein LBS77_02365 [Desulfovibrio sp.]|jgi:hypothetical protein|nr:hypothetical protein [Desulfovibrio sp.]
MWRSGCPATGAALADVGIEMQRLVGEAITIADRVILLDQSKKVRWTG